MTLRRVSTGVTYTDFSAALAAVATLTQDEVIEDIDGGSYTEAAFTSSFSGAFTLTIRAATTTRPQLIRTGTQDWLVQCSSGAKVVIEDWDLRKTDSGGGELVRANSVGADLTLRRCRLLALPGFSHSSVIGAVLATNLTLENCLISQTTATGSSGNTLVTLSNVTSATFRFCTFVQTQTTFRSCIYSLNHTAGDVLRVEGCLFRVAATNASVGILYFGAAVDRDTYSGDGNLFSKTVGTQNTAYLASPATTFANLAAWRSASGDDANSIESNAAVPHNALFANESASDYSLSFGSPAIDLAFPGLLSSPPANDLTGLYRPQANGYDAGAFERLAVFGPSGPGFKLFELPPVTGIFPFRQDVLLCSHRKPQRQEKGGNAAVWRPDGHASKPLFMLLDEGAAVFNQKQMPAWTQSSGGTGTALGAADTITKLDTNYTWVPHDGATPRRFRGQWGAAELFAGLQPGAGATTLSAALTFPRPLAENELQGCTIECTIGDAAGVAQSERRRIARSTATNAGNSASVYFTVAFGAAPTVINRFRIVGPPLKLKAQDKAVDVNTGLEKDYECNILENTAHTLKLEDTTQTPDHFGITYLSPDQDGVHMEICQEARYVLSGVFGWSCTYDPITQRFLLVNGEDPMLAYDGRRLSVAEAEWDITRSPAAELFTGTFQEDLQQGGDRVNPASYLFHQPPKGRFIASFAGRIWVASEHEIWWSAPGTFNRIWPSTLTYYAKIADPDAGPITGMEVLNDEILVFTANGIWAASPPNEQTGTTFFPRAKGVGFVGRSAAQIVESGRTMLLGANTDGVYIFGGTEPEAVLPEWGDVVPNGVNKGALHKVSAAVSRYDKCYYLAVPSAGSSVCDKLLVYRWDSKTWWLWNAPFGGIASMGVDRDELGRETVLFGFEDGHIAVLRDMEYEDGVLVEGWAKSVSLQPGTDTFALTGLMVTAKGLGANRLVTIKTYLDRNSVPRQTYVNDWDSNEGTINTHVLNQTFRPQDDSMVTRRINLPAASRGTLVQYEIRGTSQWSLRAVDLLLQRLGQRSRR